MNKLEKLEAKLKECLDEVQVLKDEQVKICKPKFEVGKWYKGTGGELTAVYCVTEVEGDAIYAYGMGSWGNWHNGCCFGDTSDNNQSPATDDEVEAMLREEANNRGFKEGCTVVTPVGSHKRTVTGTLLYKRGILKYDNSDKLDGHPCIFVRGKWATIIEAIPEYTMAQLHEKLGHFKEIKALKTFINNLNY